MYQLYLGISFTIGFIISLVIGIRLNSPYVGMALIFPLSFGIFFLIYKYSISAIKNVENIIKLDKQTNSMTLLARNEKLDKLICIKPIYSSSYEYTPEKVTYTSVTVGGVTTGGIDKREAFYSEEIKGRSGKYGIYAKMELGNLMRISEINLDESLIESAKSIPEINKFLKDNTLVLSYASSAIKISKIEGDMYQQAISNGDIYTAANIRNKLSEQAELTKDDCQNIINWICRKC